jgi:protein-L-isoaspartate(D-aspartate) O-methyltransferase
MRFKRLLFVLLLIVLLAACGDESPDATETLPPTIHDAQPTVDPTTLTPFVTATATEDGSFPDADGDGFRDDNGEDQCVGVAGTENGCPAPPTSPPTNTPETISTIPPTEPATLQPTEALVVPQDVDRDFEDTETFQTRRDALVDRYVMAAVTDERIIDALRSIPRHSFVPTDLVNQAYGDHPLPIGYGQTISQPSLVAMMTELLQIEAGDRVLEIGTGSGYQASILAELTTEVYTVEIIPELAGIARVVLDTLGYEYVKMDRRDGYFGWAEYAPFKAIIVTAAPDHLPAPLVEQLDPDGGRMVIPIGPVGNVQTLWLVTRQGDEVAMERLIPVRFVPFTRED